MAATEQRCAAVEAAESAARSEGTSAAVMWMTAHAGIVRTR